MVVLLVALCSKQGKVLFSRQYVSIAKLRVEYLLSRFLQIIKYTSNEEKQHRFIDTDDTRYLYKTLDSIYLLIITNKQSNILTDLQVLNIISQLVSKHCNCKVIGDIQSNAFDLLYAMDEVINPFGEIEQINMKQITEFVEMNSAEEKLSEIIQTSKMKSGSEIMKKKAAVFSKAKLQKHNDCATIGLSIGGARDVTNFRECIHNNIIPSLQSITYNGLIYEYYFDTTTEREYMDNEINEGIDDGSMLFYPSYCYAKVKNEYYLSVGLNSNIKQDDFKRKKLNLVIVLDTSGSMNSGFNYYSTNAKINIATKSIVGLCKHLRADDRLGLITFSSDAQCVQTLNYIQNIDMKALKTNVLNINASGGTDFESGYNAAIDLYQSMIQRRGIQSMNDEYENRVIFLTDAQPTVGITHPALLINMVSKYAEMGIDGNICNRVYTTFIGVGLDFNASLVNKISNTRGCNYYSVNDVEAFVKTMDDEFEYMVTPLVFNVCLRLNCEGNVCAIDKVYGSDDEKNIIKNGEITKINTLFPSNKCADTGETKGGIQLIKLKKTDSVNNDQMNVEIEVTFEDTKSKTYKNKQMVTFEAPNRMQYNDMIEDVEHNNNNYYDNTGIRKAILLCNYVDVLKNWIHSTKLSEHNPNYKQILLIFTKFCNYFKEEMSLCRDNTLQQELDLIKKLIDNIDSFKTSSICHQPPHHSVFDDLFDNDNDCATDLPSTEIIFSEKLFIKFDADGSMKKFEVKGELQVVVNDPDCAQCVIETNINPSLTFSMGKPTWRVHPRMNSHLWKNGILCLKDMEKKYRIGRASKTSILKWRVTSCDESKIPISIEYWVDAEPNGDKRVSVTYTCNKSLKNVIIILPICSNQHPEIQICDDGDVSFIKRDEELNWILNDLEIDDNGSLEYVVSKVQLEDLYPVSVRFETEYIYSEIKVVNVHGVGDNKQYQHTINAVCFAENYIIEQ